MIWPTADRISVRTSHRIHRGTNPHVPLPDRDETIDLVEFSDGFGRLVQSRAQAEDVVFGEAIFGGQLLPLDQAAPVPAAVGGRLPAGSGPRVLVSGWQVYDNKSHVVEKYEPFFSAGWTFQAPNSAELGLKAILDYDPRGRMVRTQNPDSSEQRVVYGVPGSIAAPDLASVDTVEPTRGRATPTTRTTMPDAPLVPIRRPIGTRTTGTHLRAPPWTRSAGRSSASYATEPSRPTAPSDRSND